MGNDLNSKALKSGFWYTLSTFLLKTIGFITTPIFTRLLTKQEFGLFSNYTSWQSIIGILLSLNVSASLITAKYDYKEDFDSYVYSVSIINIFTAIVWFALMILFPQFMCQLFGLEQKYLLVMVIYLLSSAIFSLFQSKEQFLYKYKWNVLLAVTNSLASTLISLVCVILFSNKLDGRIYGMVFPTVILSCILFYILGKKAFWKFKISTWKYALKLCIPYIPHTLSLILLSSMDKIMITKMCSAEDTAIYGLAYMCGAIITILISSMNSAFAPWLGDKLIEKKYRDIEMVIYGYSTIFIILAFGFMLLTPEVLMIMGGKSYLEAKHVMAPVSLGIIFQFLYTMFVNVEQFKKKVVPMAFATMVAALSNYILNLIFIPQYGYVAAAYTTATSYLLLLLAHMFIVFKIGEAKAFNYKFIIFCVLWASVISAVAAFLYKFNNLRYIIVAVYTALLIGLGVTKRKNIFVILKNIKSRG